METILLIFGEMVGVLIGVIIGSALWDLWLKRALFPGRFNNLVYVIDISLKREDETFDAFIDRANNEDLGEYKAI